MSEPKKYCPLAHPDDATQACLHTYAWYIGGRCAMVRIAAILSSIYEELSTES